MIIKIKDYKSKISKNKIKKKYLQINKKFSTLSAEMCCMGKPLIITTFAGFIDMVVDRVYVMLSRF
jgi:hypothetical protein